MNGRAYQKYNRYHNWWATIEKSFIVIAILLFLVLYVSQLLNFVIMQKGGSLLTIQIEKLEGKALSNSQTKLNTGTVEFTVITNSDYENIQIYLNGEYYGSFNKKSVSMTVKNNDIIEISGIHNEYPARIKLTNKSENVIGLEAGKIITVNRDFATAGRIRLK